MCNLSHVQNHCILTFVFLIIMFLVSGNFSLKHFSLNIIRMKFKTWLIIKYFRKNMLLISFLKKKHYLSLLDTDILSCSHFHKQCICSKPTWTSWLINRLLTLNGTTWGRASLSTAFVVGPMVLPREKYPCNTIQLWRYTPTNARRAKSEYIALTGGTTFLRFYLKIWG